MLSVVEYSSDKQSYGYGKRPLWQWILLYIIIGAVVYAVIYYFVFAKKGTYNPVVNYMQQATPTATQQAPSSNIYMSKTDASKGAYMTDFQGMTLYTFDKDTAGMSNCYNSCATLWPAYTSGATAQGSLSANITLVTRTDGSKQFAWKGMPLYYYAKDQKPGDLLGDGIGSVWHIVKL